jgi:hypothetical protein
VNLIWTQQTNVEFSLSLTAPAPITDEALITKALRLKSTTTAELPEIVDAGLFKEILKSLRGPGADFTIFLVKKVGVEGDTRPDGTSRVVSGNADSALQMCLVGDDLVRYFWVRAMAHETGHFVGRYHRSDGSIKGFDDLYSDSNLLMRTGGGGCKIPLEHTISTVGAFNAGY